MFKFLQLLRTWTAFKFAQMRSARKSKIYLFVSCPLQDIAHTAGPFIVWNEPDEASTLKRWFTHMQQVCFNDTVLKKYHTVRFNVIVQKSARFTMPAKTPNLDLSHLLVLMVFCPTLLLCLGAIYHFYARDQQTCSTLFCKLLIIWNMD